MLTQDVPQWMQQSFIRSAKAAGATASTEEIIACYEKLVQLWSAPDRHHHDIRHLLDMLRRIDTMAPETPHADWVRLAAWFHGIVFSTSDLAVYTRNGGEDERASAKVAQEYLARLGVEPDVVRAVTKLIVGLKKPHRVEESAPAASSAVTSSAATTPAIGAAAVGATTVGATASAKDETSTIEMIDMDQLAICDAHLGALAVEPQKYRHYLHDIQVEYTHIPFAHFLFARAQIVSKLLARKKLFYSPLATQWERPARENLEAELERIKAKLEQLSTVPVAEKKHELDSNAADEPAMHSDADADVPTGNPAGSTDVPDVETDTDASDTREQLLADDTAALAETTARSSADELRSSLEKLDDMFSPGPAPKKNLTPEEAEREARKKTAKQAWETIEAKNNEAKNGL